MRVDKETMLFTVLTGSRLYGTAGAASDLDYKAVCLPSLDDLLMNKKLTNRKQKPEGIGPSEKMLAGESETEYLPLQVFMDDFFAGQTYAVEVVFAVLNPYASGCTFGKNVTPSEHRLIIDMLTIMKNNFLTRDVKKMMGYAVGQAKNYGVKADRHATFAKAHEILLELDPLDENPMLESKRLSEVNLTELLALPHVRMSTIKNAKGGMEDAPAIEICGKMFPLSNRIQTVEHSLSLTLQDYGHRVKQFSGTGADYKALSHALRVSEQAVELVTTGKMTFPRPNASYLLEIKNGKHDVNEVLEQFEEMFKQLDESIPSSPLPERTPELVERFNEFKLTTLKRLYQL